MRRLPNQFLREVREEWRKIVWPSWKETWLSALMVAAMVIGMTITIALVDGLFGFLSSKLYAGF